MIHSQSLRDPSLYASVTHSQSMRKEKILFAIKKDEKFNTTVSHMTLTFTSFRSSTD